MPQITLECTSNVLEKTSITQLLPYFHQVLSEKLPTELKSCKSRVLIHDIYMVGDADHNNAFVHLSIAVLKGRSTALLDEIASILMEKLKSFFHQSLTELNLQITIAVQNLPDVYHKFAK